MDLSVVLPCLDERETLGTCIAKATDSIRRLGIEGEVVVADNGSTDGSREIAKACGARVVDVPRRGYGAALNGGIRAARGRYVLMADADDSYSLDELGPFVAALDEGADLVVGNRFQGGIDPGAMPWLHRYVGNPVLSLLGRLFFKAPVGDFHCGMRAFGRDRMVDLDIRSQGMEFASEMIVRASLAQLRIVEVPTRLHKDGRSRPPHLRTWRDGWRHLRFLLAFSPRWLLLYPAVVLIVFGLLTMGLLLTGPLTIGQVTFDIQTLLAGATAVVVGTQAWGLSVVSRSYAAELGLLPPVPKFERAVEIVTVEHGVGVGSALVLSGLVGFVASLVGWGRAGFGALDVFATMRIPIVAMVLLVVGFQLVTLSFAMSLSHTYRREATT